MNEGYLVTGSEEQDITEVQLMGSSSRGHLVHGKKKTSVINWTARDEGDCLRDLDSVKKELISSLKSRYENCCHPAFKTISKCLDMHRLVSLLCGTRDPEKAVPYDNIALTLYGCEEFDELYKYIASIPRIAGNKSVTFHPALAHNQYDSIKKSLASIIWGDNFAEVGTKIFKVSAGPLSGQFISELDGDPFITEFTKVDSSKFELESSFQLKLSTSDAMLQVKLEESKL